MSISEAQDVSPNPITDRDSVEASLRQPTFEGVYRAMTSLTERPDARVIPGLPGGPDDLGRMWAKSQTKGVYIPESVSVAVFNEAGVEATRPYFRGKGFDKDVVAHLDFDKTHPVSQAVRFSGSVALLADNTITISAECLSTPGVGRNNEEGFEVAKFAKSLSLGDIWGYYLARNAGEHPSYKIRVNQRMGNNMLDALPKL